jgi:hypothetical protein
VRILRGGEFQEICLAVAIRVEGVGGGSAVRRGAEGSEAEVSGEVVADGEADGSGI